MVNALRTVLLNIDGSISLGKDYPGEQYVPADFRPRKLPGVIQRVRNLLLGSDADRALLNWRLQELLTCVHTTDMGNFALALDPRITYLPFNSNLMTRKLAGPIAKKISAPTQALYFQGNPAPIKGSGKIYFKWRLTLVDSTTARVTRQSEVGSSAATIDVPYTITDGLSSDIALDGADLAVKVESGVGGTWDIELLTGPARTLKTAFDAAETGLTGTDQSAVFDGPAPYDTFKAVWETHDQLPYRIAALTLALGYRINELPPG